MAFAVLRLDDLAQSLQTDELLSAWVTSDTIGDTVWRAQRFQGNSAAYFVFLWFWRQLVGTSEVLLRLPSLIAVVFSIRQLVRFGRDLGNPDLGAIAGALLVGGASVATSATTARPYGFLLLFAILSTHNLWRYCSAGHLRHGLAWILSFVLAIAMTPFAATLAAVHLALFFARWPARPSIASFTRLAAFGVALTAPLVPQVLALSNRRESLVIIYPPSLVDVVIVAVPWLAVIGVGALAIIGFDPERGRAHLADARLYLFVAWAALPPILLYLAGVLGDSPVFSGRYRSVGLFGGCLLTAALVTSLRRPVAIVAAVVVGLFSAFMIQTPAGDGHGWRDAISAVDAATSQTEDRVLGFNSGLIETEDHANLTDPEWHDYLSAAVDHYEFDGPVVLLSVNPPSQELLDDRMGRLFEHEVIAIIDGPANYAWQAAVIERAAAEGYSVESDTQHDVLTVTILRR